AHMDCTEFNPLCRCNKMLGDLICAVIGDAKEEHRNMCALCCEHPGGFEYSNGPCE
uniref:Trypsin inhibitor n=1 Tax=Halocynthia roretzi TaxID=7729 RepID=ITRP_HALRO|nr:RecName: Full=Trypsin inhibitor; AltName: Full=ATI [Halocynthia roretzi]1IW4_A Chain A, trypsin inhibitor [Halocynthia roretzi]